MSRPPAEPGPDTLELYVIGSHWDWGLPSMSPFGLKLATWLRMTGLPHQLRIEDDPRKGPKRKSPWIVDSGRVLGDTELIIEHLERTRGVAPDAHLDVRQRTTALLLRRTFEEHFHQILDYSLFVLDSGWEQARAHFDFLPGIIRPVVVPLIRADCRKEAFVRGIGRHSLEEIEAKAAADIAAAAQVLGDQAYFFGDEPTTTDCTMFGFLAHTLWAPNPYFGQRLLRQHANLVGFCERMRQRYFAPAGAGDTAGSTSAVAAAGVREDLARVQDALGIE